MLIRDFRVTAFFLTVVSDFYPFIIRKKADRQMLCTFFAQKFSFIKMITKYRRNQEQEWQLDIVLQHSVAG
jgi:hypothetical protein